jgi:hypothetical protein
MKRPFRQSPLYCKIGRQFFGAPLCTCLTKQQRHATTHTTAAATIVFVATAATTATVIVVVVIVVIIVAIAANILAQGQQRRGRQGWRWRWGQQRWRRQWGRRWWQRQQWQRRRQQEGENQVDGAVFCCGAYPRRVILVAVVNASLLTSASL